MTSILPFNPVWQQRTQKEYAQETAGQFQDVVYKNLSNGKSVAVEGHAFDNGGPHSSGPTSALNGSHIIQSSEDFLATLNAVQHTNSSELAKADFAAGQYRHVQTSGPDDMAILSISHSRWLNLENAKVNEVGLKEIITSDQISLDRMESMLQAEVELKQQYGDNIKVAYDNHRDQIIMLTPEDSAYDQALTGQQALQNLQLAINNHTDDFDVARAKQIMAKYS